ncbi:MAG: hypothetical protein QM813_00700 [Verrucomicrobiota bacterium]
MHPTRHPAEARTLFLLMRWLRRTYGDDFVMQEPQLEAAFSPVAIALRKPILDLATKPALADIVLAIDFTAEPQDSLYARARVAEYWAIDVVPKRWIVHRDPISDVYRTVHALGEYEIVPLRGMLVSSFF